MSRKKIIVGSLAGAVAIHLAFVACSSAGHHEGTDGGASDGPLDALVDAAQNAMDAMLDGETRDAHAQDTGGCTCTTPTFDWSFALTLDRGHGAETPRSDYSTASVGATPTLVAGVPAVPLSGIASFYLADGASVYVSCTALARPDRTVAASDSYNTCSIQLRPSGADGGSTGALQGVGAVDPSAVTVTTLNDTHLEFHISSVTASLTGGPMVTLSNVVFRATALAAHYLTPPHAYQP